MMPQIDASCAGLVLGILFVAAALADEAAPAYKGPKEAFHIYAVAGDAGVISTAELCDQAGTVMDRCYVLTDDGKWVEARMPQGPDGKVKPLLLYGFAKAMLEENKDVSIGLISCTAAGTRIEDWHRKSEPFRGIRRHAKTAEQTGVLKGMLWRHGTSFLGSALASMKDLFGFVRAEQGLNLPIVVGEIPGNQAMNAQLAALARDVHAVGVASIAAAGKDKEAGADREDLQALGEDYARQMLRIPKDRAEKMRNLKPSNIPLFDAHVHVGANSKDGLDGLAQWMEKNNIVGCYNHDLTPMRPADDGQRAFVVQNYERYRGKILRFTYIEPDEVSTVEEAVQILEKEKADGAVGFGEHYGRDMMFDDPRNLRLYEACEKAGLPVMFHIDQNKNMTDKSMREVERVLEMFPKCKLIAHSYWWERMPDGTCDRMLQKYPNLYCDTSATLGVLNRDRKYTREFLIRNADKVLYGTDGGWWGLPARNEENGLVAFFEQLDLPREVLEKIYNGNAARLFGISKED